MLSREAPFDKQVMNELIEEKLLTHLWQSDYRPQNKSELSRALELDSKDRPILRACLKGLEEAGTILKGEEGPLCPSGNKRPNLGGNLSQAASWR